MEAYAATMPVETVHMSKAMTVTVEEQFMNLPEHTRAELIGGKIYYFASPLLGHQRIKREIFNQLGSYLRGKRCETLDEFDVQLEEKRKDVLRPDIIVVCDPNKLKDPRRVIGVPDMIVEILSPSTRRHDLLFKMDRYRSVGVREYWVVDPEARITHVYTLTNGAYTAVNHGAADIIKVSVLDDCVIDMNLVFPPEEESAEVEIDLEVSPAPAQP